MLTPWLRIRSRLLARVDRGAAIIEFALLVPILILALCGLSDFAITIFARLLTANAASGLSDLVSQSSMLQTSDITNVYNAAYAMMQPLSSSSLTLRVTNVAADGNGNAFVYWSCGHGTLGPYVARSNMTTSPTGSPITNNYLYLYDNYPYFAPTYHFAGTNTSFVMVEAVNNITPPTQFVLKTTQVMSTTSYTLPRISTYVGFPWDGVQGHTVKTPTTATSTATTSVVANGVTVTCNYSY